MNLNTDWLIVVQGSNILTAIDKPWEILKASALAELLVDDGCSYLIGDYFGQSCHVIELEKDIDGYEWINLRSQLGRAPDMQYQLASRAIQLVTWMKQHQYCGQCGANTHYHEIESALHCQPCGIYYYPRISPCMMCMITKGDYCLLAQHQKHAGGFYSTLAGFVEAGESIEQTLHREVMEEVGLTVKNLSYFSSQPWPFPHQLMVGYFAEYDAGDIIVDGEEIIDAQWFHYSDLPQVPPSESLSGMMIEAFVQQRSLVSADKTLSRDTE
ncbi:NADH pyrophosphatase [gamma proteobacterium IMCC1989]|nr:NADH pyrophosphatase [gamma proteobacterium IMCC1989]